MTIYACTDKAERAFSVITIKQIFKPTMKAITDMGLLAESYRNGGLYKSSSCSPTHAIGDVGCQAG